MILLDAQMSMRRSRAKQTLHASLNALREKRRWYVSNMILSQIEPSSLSTECSFAILPADQLGYREKFADEMFWRLATLTVDFAESDSGLERSDKGLVTPRPLSAKGRILRQYRGRRPGKEKALEGGEICLTPSLQRSIRPVSSILQRTWLEPCATRRTTFKP